MAAPRAEFGKQRRRTAELAAQADPLDGAQTNQNNRSGKTQRCVARQQTGQTSCGAHDQDVDQERPSPAHAIAKMSENKGAEQPRRKARAERQIGKYQAKRRRQVGEKDFWKDAGRGVTEDEKVIKLDQYSGRRREGQNGHGANIHAVGPLPCRCLLRHRFLALAFALIHSAMGYMIRKLRSTPLRPPSAHRLMIAYGWHITHAHPTYSSARH